MSAAGSGPRSGGGGGRLILVTALEGASDPVALGSGLAARCGGVVCEVGGSPVRTGLLASSQARAIEARLVAGGFRATTRGAVCRTVIDSGDGSIGELERLASVAGAPVFVCAGPAGWRLALDALDPGLVAGAVLAADLSRQRSLAALAAADLIRRGVRVGVVGSRIGLAGRRRAAAGVGPGGAVSRRIGRLVRRFGLETPVVPRPPTRPRVPLASEGGQALPAVLGAIAAILAIAVVAAALGGAAAGAGRVQSAADLAAISAARAMRDDRPRLLAPSVLRDGRPNPWHLTTVAYLARARAAALDAAHRNGVPSERVAVSFPREPGQSPLRARVTVRAEWKRAAPGAVPVVARAEAELSISAPSLSTAPTVASGGGYSGPLAYRQGKPLRPDVAGAFDALAAAAAATGVTLTINSAFRSDAEQAVLFAAHPDPRWVAPPGTSLHRCGTELDLGASDGYAWLGANGGRFGFIQRYEWEPWHWGFAGPPAPCSAAADSNPATAAADGDGSAGPSLPDFVPPRYRAMVARAASRWNVSPGLLAAQLMAESGFDPNAVSAAGALGIAQFMPATAIAYGLGDPFDPAAAIAAQARLMAELLRRFGSAELALAAYNAGSGAVAECSCVPPYEETQAYVARVLGLMAGAGEAAPPQLEVRLVA